jgi:hypothetical protein
MSAKTASFWYHAPNADKLKPELNRELRPGAFRFCKKSFGFILGPLYKKVAVWGQLAFFLDP